VFSRLKAKAVETAINTQISRYGQIEIVDLDTSAGKVSGKLHLEGETTPISFDLGYRFLAGEGSTRLEISSFICDRSWLNHLAEDRLVGCLFPLQGAWAALAGKILSARHTAPSPFL
jgi:hypothetical protein